MSRKYSEEIIVMLERLSTGDLTAVPEWAAKADAAICMMVDGECAAQHVPNIFLDAFFMTWEHWIGCVIFPVPDPSDMDSTRAAENIFLYEQATRRWEGEYGNLRMDLCRHIAKEMRNGSA